MGVHVCTQSRLLYQYIRVDGAIILISSPCYVITTANFLKFEHVSQLKIAFF